jgi:DNA-binding NtrC family response regulator
MTTNSEPNRPVVLVVDDEPETADSLTQVLKQNGYAAFTAYHGVTALQAALLRPPALLISDVMLLGMNGIQLGITIRRIFPECKVILASGQPHADSLLAAALSAGNRFVFLQKPVHPKMLLEHVADTLKSECR